MGYLLRRSVGVEQSIERLAAADRDGASLVRAAILGLAENPRPAGVHVLNEAECLHRIHLSRLDRHTGRTLQYRVMYQIQDRDLIVIVMTAAALPKPSRRLSR